MPNALPCAVFPGNQCPATGFPYRFGAPPVPAIGTSCSSRRRHHREQFSPDCREPSWWLSSRGYLCLDRHRPRPGSGASLAFAPSDL